MLMKVCLALFAVSLTVNARILGETPRFHGNRRLRSVANLLNENTAAGARSIGGIDDNNNSVDLNQNSTPNVAGSNQVDDIKSNESGNAVAVQKPIKKPAKRPNKKKPNKNNKKPTKKPNKKKPGNEKKSKKLFELA